MKQANTAKHKVGFTVVGIGELLWDCFADSRRPGGAPANVVFHLGQLGISAAVCSRVGRDDPGEELLRYLRDHDVSTDLVQQEDERPTGKVTVNADQADNPTYVIHEDVAWDYIELDRPLRRAARDVAAVCFGTLAQRSLASRETIRQVVQIAGDAVRVFDVNLRPPFYNEDVVRGSLALADVVKLNIQELSIVAEMAGLRADTPVSQARAMCAAFGFMAVCVTRGEGGCLLVSEHECVDLPGEHVSVVDAVGAGDAFTAGLIYGLLADWPLRQTGWLANGMGGLVASRQGAMPALGAEFEALAKETAG